jgi:hypothetical protein
MLNTYEISNVFDEHEISNAFDAVARLTEAIELSATRDDDNIDGSTAVEILQSLIVGQEDNPESRGNATEAREALHALQTAAELLTAVLRRGV